MVREPRVDPAWQNLGNLLIDRRIHLDPRYRNRTLFCAEKGVDYRVISDIEAARRANFSGPMITTIEIAYEIAAGAIADALANPTATRLAERSDSKGLGVADRDIDAASRGIELPAEVHLADLPKREQDLWLLREATVQERRALVHFDRLNRGDLTDDESLLSLYRAIGDVLAHRLGRDRRPTAG